ncbi:GAF and ANTAR domain-containing protein [Pseudarthrobacter sp. NamE5]|uniref:GAF and ANTAR domain-containing protein n=1 Tax=Pseudarthrobacter sp. NamE5 TaxID=2576839 RepID=UPI00110C1602|nr:GAF and ANTAR domain-containing protein [Pseudarthrobacter sp. NamE5]TLM81809.1 GAF and ANTAR domain-containing protein [Pseudarthrobacter sp. NamE5]
MATSKALTTSDEFQDLLLESPGFPEFLLGLATLSASSLSSDQSVECTITVERDGVPSTVASSSEEAQHLDETQYAFDDGPCLTAVRRQRMVLIQDLGSDGQWRSYSPTALREGIHSVLAVPIPAGPSARAALNCYARTAYAFDQDSVECVEELAASMSRILQLALRLHTPEAYPEHLRAALKSRAVMDAAVSLIMLQHRGGRDGALDILQAAAKSSNRRIHEIASDIVQTGRAPSTPAEGG